MDNFENIQTNQEYDNENFTYIPSNKNLSDYSFNFNKNVETKDIKTNIFKDIIGYDNQKEDLSYVIRWFRSSKELKKKGVTVPKGVLLFGKPGNGKSFFIKEIIKNCNFPTFIFKGEGKEMADSIYEIFRIARKYSQSIIVFDELDLLINKQERVMRAQRECLDGVESFDDILVLAATNDLYEIPDALIRHGRLEKLISIPYPTEEEAYEMLEYYFQEFNIKLSDDIDKDEISSLLTRFTCAAIKSIANETVLKNGFENITTEMIEDSIYSASDRIKDSPRENNFEVAVHEAGHGAVAYSFPDFFIVNRMNINPLGGYFHAKEVNAGYLPYNKMIADIKISMAGILSEKIICGVDSNGCKEDLQKARKYAYNMFNMYGYSSCWETLPAVSGDTRTETFIKRRKMERKIEALLKKCEKDTIKYIKAHKSLIIALAKLLYEKKNLKSSEIISCLR